MDDAKEDLKVIKLPHHEYKGKCTTRPKYRQGNRLTAVKVYTVNEESQHLIIRGVPSLNLHSELKRTCIRYGDVKRLVLVPDYSKDEELFTQVYQVTYSKIQSARFAKRMLDEKSFFGGVLHVFYAPELESISETRVKLKQRKREISIRIQAQLKKPSNYKQNFNTSRSTEKVDIEPSESLIHQDKGSSSWAVGGLRETYITSIKSDNGSSKVNEIGHIATAAETAKEIAQKQLFRESLNIPYIQSNNSHQVKRKYQSNVEKGTLKFVPKSVYNKRKKLDVV